MFGTKYSYLYQYSPKFKFQNQFRLFRVQYGRFKIVRRMSSQFIQEWPKTLNEYIFGSTIHVRFESFNFLWKYYVCDIPEGMIVEWRWFSTHSSIVIQILPKTAKLSDSWLDLQSSIPYWSTKSKNLKKQLLQCEKEIFIETSFIIHRMPKKWFRFQVSLHIVQPHLSIHREFQFCH